MYLFETIVPINATYKLGSMSSEIVAARSFLYLNSAKTSGYIKYSDTTVAGKITT